MARESKTLNSVLDVEKTLGNPFHREHRLNSELPAATNQNSGNRTRNAVPKMKETICRIDSRLTNSLRHDVYGEIRRGGLRGGAGNDYRNAVV